MDAFFSFLKVAVICITALFALIAVLAMLPNSPIRDILFALSKRIGATATAIAFVPPLDTLPVAGEAYDIIALVAVILYWLSLSSEIQGSKARFAENAQLLIPLKKRDQA